jgi:hypothetical protein
MVAVVELIGRLVHSASKTERRSELDVRVGERDSAVSVGCSFAIVDELSSKLGGGEVVVAIESNARCGLLDQERACRCRGEGLGTEARPGMSG